MTHRLVEMRAQQAAFQFASTRHLGFSIGYLAGGVLDFVDERDFAGIDD